MTVTSLLRCYLLAITLLVAVPLLDDLSTLYVRSVTSYQLIESTPGAVTFRGTFNSWLFQSMRKSRYTAAHPNPPSTRC